MVYGEERALAYIDELTQRHPDLPRLATVRGHLLERLGRSADAAAAYWRAIWATQNIAEREHLLARLRRLRPSTMDE